MPNPQDQTKPHHDHGEAFMMLVYRCQAQHARQIWNSRDGVTPFGTQCLQPGCQHIAYHADWKQDRYEPAHQLLPGEWFFRDGTPDEARAIVQRRLQNAKGTPYERDESTWPDLINDITRGEFLPGWPMLVQVPAETAKPEPDAPIALWANSLLSAKTKEPLVSIHWKDVVCQLSPAEARAFALSVLGAAEAAEQDAFLFSWVLDKIGCDDAAGIMVLRQFREWRDAGQKGKS